MSDTQGDPAGEAEALLAAARPVDVLTAFSENLTADAYDMLSDRAIAETILAQLDEAGFVVERKQQICVRCMAAGALGVWKVDDDPDDCTAQGHALLAAAPVSTEGAELMADLLGDETRRLLEPFGAYIVALRQCAEDEQDEDAAAAYTEADVDLSKMHSAVVALLAERDAAVAREADALARVAELDELAEEAQRAIEAEGGRLRHKLMVPGCPQCQSRGERCTSHPDPLDVAPWPLLTRLLAAAAPSTPAPETPTTCPTCNGHPQEAGVRIEGGSKSCRYCNRTLTFNFMDRPGGLCSCDASKVARCPTCLGSGAAAAPETERCACGQPAVATRAGQPWCGDDR